MDVNILVACDALGIFFAALEAEFVRFVHGCSTLVDGALVDVALVDNFPLLLASILYAAAIVDNGTFGSNGREAGGLIVKSGRSAIALVKWPCSFLTVGIVLVPLEVV